jgi:hypothetical protein
MESSVTSQISPKLYSGDIKKLYKDDVDAQSELFEINIFNHTLHIAPGKSIADEEHDKLVYFYVYAIKDEKVIANLGVYELLTDEQKLMYDISSFENLLLFDYYYTNPGVIKEFEITGKNNIFDYIDTHLTPDPKFVEIYNTFTRYGKENKEFLGKHYASYKKIISILSKDIKKGLGGKIMELKDNCKNVDVYKLTLAILETIYNVQFSLVDEGVSVTNFRDKTPPQTFSPKQYIIASTDQSFVSTASTQPGDAEDGAAEEKDLEDGEIDEQAVAAEEPGPESVVGEDIEESGIVESGIAESSASALEKEGGDVFDVKPKIRPPSGSRVPGLKTKTASGLSTSDASAEEKPKSRSTISKSSKAEAKSEAKSEAKAEAKSKATTDPNAESKPESKSKISKLRTKAADSVSSLEHAPSKTVTLKDPPAEPKKSIPPPPSTPPTSASGASAKSVVSKRKPIPPPPSTPPPPPSERSKIGFKSNS